MMTPKQIRAMAAYFDAADRLADATDALIKVNMRRRSGLLGNCDQFEDMATFRLREYRQARVDYENL